MATEHLGETFPKALERGSGVYRCLSKISTLEPNSEIARLEAYQRGILHGWQLQLRGFIRTGRGRSANPCQSPYSEGGLSNQGPHNLQCTEVSAWLQADASFDQRKPLLEALMDKGYNSDSIRERINEIGSVTVIVERKNRALKHCRRIDTQYENIYEIFEAMITIAGIIIWMCL